MNAGRAICPPFFVCVTIERVGEPEFRLADSPSGPTPCWIYKLLLAFPLCYMSTAQFRYASDGEDTDGRESYRLSAFLNLVQLWRDNEFVI
jgi:hypothetical protein